MQLRVHCCTIQQWREADRFCTPVQFASKLVNTAQMIDAGGGAYGDLGLGFEDGSTGGDDAGWK